MYTASAKSVFLRPKRSCPLGVSRAGRYANMRTKRDHGPVGQPPPAAYLAGSLAKTSWGGRYLWAAAISVFRANLRPYPRRPKVF